MAENIGEFGLKRGSGAGKGSVISSTFGSRWEDEVKARLTKRQFPCSKCKVMKPEGECNKCAHIPENGRGW
jgi:hypothetical protein